MSTHTNNNNRKPKRKLTRNELKRSRQYNKEKLVSILFCTFLFFRWQSFHFGCDTFCFVHHLSRSIHIRTYRDVNKWHCEQLFKAKGFLVFSPAIVNHLLLPFHAFSVYLFRTLYVWYWWMCALCACVLCGVVILMIIKTIFGIKSTQGGMLVFKTMWCILTILCVRKHAL